MAIPPARIARTAGDGVDLSVTAFIPHTEALQSTDFVHLVRGNVPMLAVPVTSFSADGGGDPTSPASLQLETGLAVDSKKISELTSFDLTIHDTAGSVPVVQAGETKALSLSMLLRLMLSWLDYNEGNPLDATPGSGADGKETYFQAGAADGADGTGGAVKITGGVGGAAAAGGMVEISSGLGGSMSGAVDVFSPNAPATSEASLGTGNASAGTSGPVYVYTGDSATTASGELDLSTGAAHDASSGNLNISTGNVASGDGNGGDIALVSGTGSGTGRGGHIVLQAPTIMLPGTSGWANVQTPNTDTTDSDGVWFASGAVATSGVTGVVGFGSADNTGTGNTGWSQFGTGNASNGSSGEVKVISGSASGADAGTVTIEAGGVVSGDGHGGDIVLVIGTGSGTGRHGLIIVDTLPTTDPHVANAVWMDTTAGRVLKVSAG